MDTEQNITDAQDANHQTWEENHTKIMTALTKAMDPYKRFPPSITELSAATGLSRKCIYAHLGNYKEQPAYKERTKMFDMLQYDVLMNLCKYAIKGDTRATRLYLELQGLIQPRNGNIKGDNNVQINGLVINQQILQNLSTEQLKKIEEIIKPVQVEALIKTNV
jgi:hypothetical protein